MLMKTKDDLKIDHMNIKSFTEEEKVTLENYQAAFKCMEKLNQEMQHNI